MKAFWRYLTVGVGVTVLATLVLPATGSAIATTIGNVFVTNTATHPVPVHETNIDAHGNVKVHEQGTANVNVTNSSLSVRQPPITDGGNYSACSPGSGPCLNSGGTATASTIQVSMTSGTGECYLLLGSNIVGAFTGPAFGGQANVILPLSRPISFDRIDTDGNASTDRCRVAWVGDSP
jgi:hypothetical protein